MALKDKLYGSIKRFSETDFGKNLTAIACVTTLAGCLYVSSGGTNLPGLKNNSYNGLEKMSNTQYEEIYQPGEGSYQQGDESNSLYSNDNNSSIYLDNIRISDIPNQYKGPVSETVYG
jgi:hypothetical protein